MAVRYTVITILFAAILLYFIGGYWHAQRRLRAGLPPLSYHAWMIRRSHRYRHQNPYQQQPFPPYNHGQQPEAAGYAMPGYPQPPPAYNAFGAPPPAYQPPEGGSKAMADQNYSAPVNREGESSQAPPPPPPVARQ